MNKILAIAAVENSAQFKYITLFLEEMNKKAKEKFIIQKVTVQFGIGDQFYVEHLNGTRSNRKIMSKLKDFWSSGIEIAPSKASIYYGFQTLCNETFEDGDKLLILVFDFRNNGSGFRGSDRNTIVNILTNKLAVENGQPLNIRYYAQFIYVNKNPSGDMSSSYAPLQSIKGENGRQANIGCYDILENSTKTDVEKIDSASIRKLAHRTLKAFYEHTN